MARKKVISVALAAMMTISSVWGNSADLYQSILVNAKETTQTQEEEVVSEASQVDANEYGLADNIQDGTILHCFDWKYNDIKAELPNIAAAGFTSVQTSPAQKGDGDIWYWLYQPQTFSIQPNALGGKDELKALCDEAEKYGINVIVDVVANHTRSIGDDGLGGDCYHYDEGSIDYGPNSSRYDYTHKRIGMPDLNSESSTVQNKVKGYVQELKSVGVDGIRWDAAKHIGLPSEQCNFWPAVTGEGLYNYGEILNGPLNGYGNNDALMKEYTNYISVTDDEYGDGVLNAIKGGGVPGSIGNYSERGVDKDKLVYWAESHDTYSNNGEYGKATQYIDQNKIDRAYAIVAAQGEATSLYFSRPFSTDKQSIMAGAKGSTHFTSKEVAAVNHLHNACVGEKDYYKQENGAAVVCRESGAVIVKGSGSGQVSITNGGGTTEPGTYTDEVSGSTWTVTESTISGSVGESGIAVICNAKKSPSVSASKDSGNFTEAFELTLTPANATKATYSINDGEAVEFTKATKVTIGDGAQIGDKITVKVTAEGAEGDPFSKTFTYTMIDTPTVPEAKAYVRVSKSEFSTAPNAYVYYTSGGKTVEPNGEFPGKAMEEEGDYYSYYTNDVDKFSVIFSYDGKQDPASQQPGYDVTGYMEYTKGSGVKAFTPSTPKPATKEPEVTNTPEPVVTEEPTATPTVTTPPTETPTSTPEVTTPPTEVPTTAPWASVSVANGTSFTDETLDVILTLNGATEGTYSVDNGPEKSFKSGDKVTLGQGKIADSDVTLKVTAKIGDATKTNTFTYKKVFDASKAVVKTSAVKKLQSIFEVVAEAAQNNGTPASDYYATNPSGNVGSKKTITSASDFTEDMIIAQGVANDDPAAFKGTHEAPKFDQYAMYGAWDDTNVYIGIQYTNVIDVVDPAQEAPQQDRGKPYSEDADIPQMLVFDTRSGDYTDGTANDTVQKTAWDIDVKYSGDAKVDNVFVYSPKKNIVNQAFFPVNGGMVDYNNITKTGYHYVNAERGEKYEDYTIPGVSIQWEDGFFGSTMNGIKANGYQGYTPADLASTSAAWTDFLQTEHNKEHDTFCLITMPLSLLGVSASDIENNGIGVMSIATYGASGIGSLPADMTMLDCATEAFSQDDSTSQEKEDSDVVTVGLAQLGKSDGTVVNKPTMVPATEKPAETPVADKTPEATVTETPADKTPEVTVTETPADKTPEVTVTEEPKETTAPTEVPTTNTDIYTVNFGADRSSPQYDSTALTLKAIGYGSKDYKYEFSVDGTVVQASSEKDTYSWKGTAGTHTIKVVVTDAEGKKVTSEKTYVLDQDTSVTPTAEPTKVPDANKEQETATPVITSTPVVTKEPVVTEVPAETPDPNPMTATIKVGYAPPRKAGTKIPVTVTAKGGTAPYTYEIRVANSAGKSLLLLSSKTKNTKNWTPSKAGTYKITATVTDSLGRKATKTKKYAVSNPITVKTFKASKYTVKKGKKIKITAKATSSDTVKYMIRLKKVGAKKYTTIRKYSKTGTFNWKANKAKGKYYVYLTVKDADGHTKTVKMKKKLTIKK